MHGRSRKTWLHPSPGKSHISALLPKFSAPSRSPDMEIVLKSISFSTPPLGWLPAMNWLLPPPQARLMWQLLLSGQSQTPTWLWNINSAIFNKLHLKLTCISLGQAAPEISRICDLGVCSCPSIPGSHWKIDQIIARTWIISLTVGQDLQGLWVLLPQVIFLIWSCCGREASLRRLPDPGQIWCSPTQQLVQVLTAPMVQILEAGNNYLAVVEH